MSLIRSEWSPIQSRPRRVLLNFGNHYQSEPDNQPFIEEVVVESVLHVRSAEPGARQGRTNRQTSLKDGSRVSQPKTN
ncbi:hypothetical protein ABMA28_007320 [Loxostege sticticalis]|uniref:Uncharacterized protein n=1 Tax=Loxostege sticticalis TaxID=481309 RepID=A0ABD0TQ95_LOXSC